MESTKQEAQQKAKKLADRLNKYFKIKGWNPNVWNNLGWCYDVTLGSISVGSKYQEKYTAYVNSTLNKTGGALAAWFDNNGDKCRDKSPEKAVLKALKYAEDYINDLKRTIDDNKSKLHMDRMKGGAMKRSRNICFDCSVEGCKDRQTLDLPRTYVSKCWRFEPKVYIAPKAITNNKD
jgi:hypothetical protein